MRVRLIQITTRRSGAKARREQLREVASFSVGRGTDNQLVLNELTVSSHHAAFEQRGSAIHLVRVDAPELVINGQVSSGDRVEPGDSLRVGSFELRVVAPRQDEDLALELEQVVRGGDEREELAHRTRMGVEAGLLTRRRLAWLLALAVLVCFLAVPLLSGRFEGSWNSGPISRKHAFIANDCDACHASFERVRNEACLECHAGVGNHARAESSGASLDDARCGSCHLEHSGEGGLAEIDDPLCTDCHADLARRLPETALGNATDFADEHPEFRLFVVREPGAEPEPAPWSEELRERSGLRFSHWRHVARSVPFPDERSERLRCDACHQPDVGGKNMTPVSFEQHCRECHRLGFDDDLPGVEAMHAGLARVREQLRGLYSELVLKGELKSPDAPRAVRFLRPGQELGREEARVVFSFVEKKVAAAERHLTETPGECARCHELRPGAADDAGTQVAPVSLASVWMPKSEFRHETHGPFPCRDCHAAAAVVDPDDGEPPAWALSGTWALLGAEELLARDGLEPSESAEDVLLPRLADCRDCHGGPRATPPRVASGCVLCHPYHRDEHGTIRARQAAAAAQK